jgi:hypothetical protein
MLASFPEHDAKAEAEALLSEADEAQARRLVDLSRFYLRRYSYRPDAARRYLADVGRSFRQTAAAGEARQLLARLDPDAVFPGDLPDEVGDAGAEPELPPQPMRLLQTREEVPKWLLPLEDYSDYLPSHR